MYRKIVLDDRFTIHQAGSVISLRQDERDWNKTAIWYNARTERFYYNDRVEIPSKIATAFRMYALRHKVRC